MSTPVDSDNLHICNVIPWRVNGRIVFVDKNIEELRVQGAVKLLSHMG